MDATEKKKQRRRGRWKRRLTFLLALVITLVIAYFVITRSRLVPYQVTKYINTHVLEDTRFEFTCGAIRGDLVKNVVLVDPVVRYHGPDASYNVFRADEITVVYNITGVFRLNLVVDDLQLRNVGVQIRQDEEGRVILPVPVKADIVEESGAFAPRVEVRRFLIDGLNLFFGGGERQLAVRDVNMEGAYRLEGGIGRAEIDRGSAFIIDTGTPVHEIRMDVYHEGESVRVQDFLVRLGRSLVLANGKIVGGRFEDLQFIFNPVVLEELHQLGVIPGLEGEMGGNVTLNGEVDSLSIAGVVTGFGFGMAMNSLDFKAIIANDQIAFEHVRGDVYGTKLDGTFRYSWKGRDTFSFDGEFLGLDLVHSFLPGSGLPGMDLNGEGSIVFDGDKRYTISADVDSARVERYHTGSGVFEAVWDEDSGLSIEAFRFDRPGYSVEGSGHVDVDANMDLLFTANGTDMAYFWDYASLPPITGEVSVGGKVAGPIQDLQINLNGSVQDAGYLFATIDTAVVQAEIRGVGGDDVTAQVDVNGPSVYLHGNQFQSPHLLLEVGGGITVVRDFSFAKGDTFTTMHFDVSPADDDVEVLFRHLEMVLPGSQWRNDSPSTLTVGEGLFQLDSLVFSSGSGVVGLQGLYSADSGTVSASSWGEGFELGLLREAFDLPVRLEGKADFQLRVEGEIGNPDVELSVDAGSGAIDSLSFDSLRLRAGYDGGRWHADDLLVVTTGDSLSGAGWWSFEASPAAILSGRADLSAGTGRPFRVDFDCRHYPVSSAMDAIHAPTYVGGEFTGTLVLENTVVDPYIVVEGTLEPGDDPARADANTTAPERTGAGLVLPPTRVRIAHRDGEIEVTEVLVHGSLGATLTGFLPVGINLLEGLSPRTDEPIELQLELSSTDIGPLAAYTSRLSSLAGRAEGLMTITGSLADPVFGGRSLFTGCSVRFADLDETYTDIGASLELHDNVIELPSIRGKSRGEQAFTGSGSVEFDGFRPSDYRLNISFSDIWVTRQPDFEAQFSGALEVATYQDNDRRIPNITGRLTLKQADVVYTFESGGRRPAVTMPTASPGWICSIDLDAHKNLWVRNPDMYVELGGQLIVKRDNEGLYLRGDLSALRGSYNVYNNKFQVMEGTIDFSAAEGIRPEVYINAYTPHRVADGQERRIYLTLRWPRDKIEPEIELSSDEPGYYQSDLWRMLGGTDIAGGLAANTLEKLLNQQMSGMTVYVDRQAVGGAGGGSAEQQMMVGVGKYLFEDLYLTYRQGITFTADQVVEAEYRLRNMIYIRSGIIRHSNPRYAGSITRSTDEYNLDVKFRWEY
jgi:hypothetical protein